MYTQIKYADGKVRYIKGSVCEIIEEFSRKNKNIAFVESRFDNEISKKPEININVNGYHTATLINNEGYVLG